MSGTAEGPAGRTERTLKFLREARASYRRERRKNSAFAGYVVALFTVFWGAPLLAAAARAGERGAWHGETARQVEASLPVAAPALSALALLLVARNALWRGPVLVDLPTVSWLLPSPILRGPLLLPRLLASVSLAAFVGPVTGGVLGYLLYVAGAGGWAPLTAAGAWAGLATALTAVATGALVERHDRTVRRYGARVFGAAWVLLAGVSVLSVDAAVRDGSSWAGPVLLWSGPWGWAAQPLVSAAGHDAPGWGAGAALSAVCVLAALLLAWRGTPRIPEATLRSRATVASQLTASLFALDLRQARSTVRDPRRRGSRPALRLPVPRHPWLLVPWRDATALLRAPGRLIWGALWTAAAVALSAFASAGQPRGQIVLCALPLVAGYLAAAQLAEPARVESDDFRRSSGLPYTFRALALRHALVPGALLIAGTGVSLVLSRAAGWWAPGHLVLLAAVPALVGAALVSAYRGAVPPQVLIGGETPMGNTAALQTAVWYGRGPLGALALTTPVMVAATRQDQVGAGQLAWLLLVGACGLWWARRTAHRLHGFRPSDAREPLFTAVRTWLRTRLMTGLGR
ncbi:MULTISPECIES: DUF6297 family protein [unclassified Streptomyces]|uniref:DUF6297 family protein n=1 Tax=unclassified Streptomyces TaxID=2593676 RepID=UPI00382F5445